MELLFNSSLGLKLGAEQIVRELINFMEADLKRKYKIVIGSDSEKNGVEADFVTAIVIHRIGNGVRYFWRRAIVGKKFHTLRDRILEEVLLSLEAAKIILSHLRSYLKENKNNSPVADWDFEIHVDVGENGETKNMIQELVGMVR